MPILAYNNLLEQLKLLNYEQSIYVMQTMLELMKNKKNEITTNSDEKISDETIESFAGIWADKEEMADPVQYVRDLRRGRNFGI